MSGTMARLVLFRLGVMLVSLVIVAFAVFFATEMLPGNVVEILLGQSATPQAVAALRHAMHLDQPAFVQFLHWLAGLLSGNLGHSYVNNISVSTLIGERLANSLRLAAITTVVSVPISLALGITSAIFRGSLYDRIVSVVSISVVSVPEFLVATTAVLIFAVQLQWLPALSLTNNVHGWFGQLKIYAMPVMTLSFVISAQMIRMTRAAVIDTLNTPYCEMALLKGSSRRRVVLRHALPNALGPIANAVALSLSYLIGGVIIVETIFDYPGMAKLMVDAVSTRDIPLIQSCAMIFAITYLLLVTIADLMIIVSNPRLRK